MVQTVPPAMLQTGHRDPPWHSPKETFPHSPSHPEFAPKPAVPQDGVTPLHTACFMGHAAAAQLLLAAANVDPNARTAAGATPLLLACQVDARIPQEGPGAQHKVCGMHNWRSQVGVNGAPQNWGWLVRKKGRQDC